MVQQFLGDGGDARLQLRHHARCEGQRDQVAELAMAWRVHLQDAGSNRVALALEPSACAIRWPSDEKVAYSESTRATSA